MQEIAPHVALIDRKAPNLSEADVETMKGDPVRRYLHSLRTSSRLPEELHEAMILHASDPAYSESVRGYLKWARSCEERESRKIDHRRRESIFGMAALASTICVAVAHAAFVLWVVIL